MSRGSIFRPTKRAVLAIIGSWGTGNRDLVEIIDLVMLPIFFLPYIDCLIEAHSKIALIDRVIVVDILVEILETPATILDREELVSMPDQVDV